MDIREVLVEIPTPNISPQVVVPLVVSQSHNISEQRIDIPNPQDVHIDDEPANNVQVTNKRVVDGLHEIALRRSMRQKRPAISDDYVVYSLEHECDLSIDEGPVSFKQAMECNNSEK